MHACSTSKPERLRIPRGNRTRGTRRGYCRGSESAARPPRLTSHSFLAGGFCLLVLGGFLPGKRPTLSRDITRATPARSAAQVPQEARRSERASKLPPTRLRPALPVAWETPPGPRCLYSSAGFESTGRRSYACRGTRGRCVPCTRALQLGRGGRWRDTYWDKSSIWLLCCRNGGNYNLFPSPLIRKHQMGNQEVVLHIPGSAAKAAASPLGLFLCSRCSYDSHQCTVNGKSTLRCRGGRKR